MMETNDAVSICIPSYNGKTFLREALESAVNQTYPHIEVLIVDDGSTDETIAIANEFVAVHAFVRLINNTDKKGMVNNWERCITEAKHNWIKYLFQDDVLSPDCVQKMMALCKEVNTIASFCRRDFIIEDNAPQATLDFIKIIHKPETLFNRGIVPPEQIARQVYKYGTENIIGEPTCLLFHKTLVQKIGRFDARFKQSVDLEFALRAGLTQGIAFTPEPLVKFRIHGGSETSANTNAREDAVVLKRSIRSMWGDDILLLNTYLTDENFTVVRERWTAAQLKNRIRFLYLKACRQYGKNIAQEALQDVIAAVPCIKNLGYNYLLYKIEKYKHKQFLKQRKQEFAS